MKILEMFPPEKGEYLVINDFCGETCVSQFHTLEQAIAYCNKWTLIQDDQEDYELRLLRLSDINSEHPLDREHDRNFCILKIGERLTPPLQVKQS